MGGTMEPEATPIANATVIHNYRTDDVLVNEEIVPLVDVILDDSAGGSTPKWQDVPFAVLFWIHFAVMLWLGIAVAPKGFETVHMNLEEIEDEMRKGDDVTEEDIRDFEDFLNKAAAYMEIYPVRIGLIIVLPCCLLAFLFGFMGTIVFLKPCPRTMIYGCLLSSFVWTGILLLGGAIASGSIFLYIISGITLAAIAYYVRMAWRMVPFAAVNLKIALAAIWSNNGIFVVALGFAVLSSVWVIFWFYVVIGTSALHFNNCKEKHPDINFYTDDSDVCQLSTFAMIFFLLSLYWTSSVVMNTIQVSVSGVTATWCFDPAHANSFCSSAITGSLFRSITYSFGSICLGSLLQAIVAVIQYLIDQARAQQAQGDSDACGSIVLCILDCIVQLLGDLLRAFNQWAYVYVGLYGYSYIESGKRVMDLFVAKGFTAIITDNLVGYVLGFTSFMIGLASAVAGWLLEHYISEWASPHEGQLWRELGPPHELLGIHPLDPPPPDNGQLGPPHPVLLGPPPPDHLMGRDPMGPPPPDSFNLMERGPLGSSPPDSFNFGPLPNPGIIAACIGFLIGLWVASVMMNVLKGAVNTLIVCWADSPASLESKHPVMSRELSSTWRSIFNFLGEAGTRSRGGTGIV